MISVTRIVIGHNRAASMDSITDLVRFINPFRGEFLKRLREEHVPLPAEEVVWRDPARLHGVLDKLSPAQLEMALKKTEEILGMLSYAS